MGGVERRKKKERKRSHSFFSLSLPPQSKRQAAPDDRPDISKLKEEITIPTALVTKATGKKLKEALDKASAKGGSRSEKVIAELDWTDAVAHPDARVEWELWSTPDDGCGASCDRQLAFKRSFERQAVELEKGGFAQFTPRFVTRRCSFGASEEDRSAPECQRSCIHEGRYCSMTPVGDAFKGKYGGMEVVTEAKRQLCAFEAATKAEKPWTWWRFSVKAAEDCTMRKGKFGDDKCLREALDAAGIDRAAVDKCVGDVSSDAESAIMESNLDAQGLGGGSSSRVLITPTVVINGAQYRGRLDAPSVTRGLCAGFSEATEPPACLTPALEVNECASANNGGCWKSDKTDAKTSEPLFSACVDTFRGFKCQCPFGFRGDGRASSSSKHGGCEDIDECAEGTDQCDQECENTPGGYTCSCREGYKQVGGNAGLGACFPADGGVGSAGAFGRGGTLSVVSFVGVVAAAAIVALLAGFIVHRRRARAEARAEVAAILRQYMPLEGDDNGGIPASSGSGGSDGSGFNPFGRPRGNTSSSLEHPPSSGSAGAFFGAFAEGDAGARSGGSGNYSSGASEVGLTPTASSAEAEAEREAAEKKSGSGSGSGGAAPPSSSNV